MHRLARAGTLGVLGIVSFALAGCHIHNSNPVPCPSGGCSPTGGPTGTNGLPFVDTSRPITISSGGGNAVLAASGISGTLVFASNNGSAVPGTFHLTTSAPIDVTPSGTPLLFFETQLTSDVTFTAPYVVSPVVFPKGFPTGGVTFTETLYDEATGNSIGSPATGVVNGETVTFPAPTGSFPTTASDVYLSIVSSS